MGKSETEPTAFSRLGWLYKISGITALVTGALFLIAALDLLSSVLQTRVGNNWLTIFQNNWLVVIFKLHAGFNESEANLLHIVNFLDLAILALVGVTILGLYAALRSSSKIWAAIALIQPFIGIALFLVTQTAGRSSVMGAVLVISAIMLRNEHFNKTFALIGMLASLLLLAGDFTVGTLPPTKLMAVLFGIGYVLLMTWFFLVAPKLFQLGKGLALKTQGA